MGCNTYFKDRKQTTAKTAFPRDLHSSDNDHMKIDDNFRQIMEVIPDAALVVNGAGRIVFANGLLCQMFGYRSGALLEQDLSLLIPESSRTRHHSAVGGFFTRLSNRPMGRGLQFRGLRASGETFPVAIMLSHAVLDGEDHAIAFVRDHTQLQAVEDRIRHELEQQRAMAHTDPLTGLGNRRAFDLELAEELRELRRQGRQFAIGFIDLDDFKQVNDRFGHELGDRVLQELGQLIRDACRGSDLVARIGGDEFATIHPGASQAVALQVLERMRQQFLDHVRDKDWPVTLSMGLCLCNDPGADYRAEDLLAAADRAMYEAKQLGKNRIRVADLQNAQLQPLTHLAPSA